MTQVNGTTQAQDAALLEPLAAGYKPSLPVSGFWNNDGTPNFYVLRDIEVMQTHAHVARVMGYYKSGVYGAEFECKKSSGQDVADFVLAQCQRFWDMDVARVQQAYEYGWTGCEVMYEIDTQGMLKYSHMSDFSPRDVYVLTQGNTYAGIRVKAVTAPTEDGDAKGFVDLWGPRQHVPAKGFYFAHRARWGQWYGRTQYQAAWRAWRRLAGQDGAETVVDGGIYRFAYCGPVVRYPQEDFIKNKQQVSGAPAWTFARDEARRIAEWAKSGASFALPSNKYPQDSGGHFKWEIDWPKQVISVDPLLNYASFLKDEIAYGIGVPPELMQAAETGSGYSGRRIPLEAFLVEQQANADALLRAFVQQVLKPVVARNFGPAAWFEVTVKSLLASKNAAAQPAIPGLDAGAPPIDALPAPEPSELPADAPADLPPPTEENALRSTVGELQAITELQKAFFAGEISKSAAIANAKLVFQFEDTEAQSLFPDERPQMLAPADAGQPTQMSLTEVARQHVRRVLESDESLRSAWIAYKEKMAARPSDDGS